MWPPLSLRSTAVHLTTLHSPLVQPLWLEVHAKKKKKSALGNNHDICHIKPVLILLYNSNNTKSCIVCLGNLYLLLSTAEKVTEKLTEMTGQVAPGDVSSVYGIRRAMGITLPAQPPESFIDLTTGKDLSCHFKNKNICQATSEMILLAYSGGDGWTDGDCVQLSGCSPSRRCIVQFLPSCNLMKCSFMRLLYALQLINSFLYTTRTLVKCCMTNYIIKQTFITFCNCSKFNVTFVHMKASTLLLLPNHNTGDYGLKR